MDLFHSNKMYKNSYTFYFQPLLDILFGMNILSQWYKVVKVDGKWKRVQRRYTHLNNEIMRWMLERGIHKINIAYVVKLDHNRKICEGSRSHKTMCPTISFLSSKSHKTLTEVAGGGR